MYLAKRSEPQALAKRETQLRPPMQSIPEQIQKLADLKNSGILTAEEFESKKKDLLSTL
jgi:hypothetical protein